MIFSPAIRPSGINTTSPAFLSFLSSNSREAKDASLRFARGLTSTYTDYLQRGYYRASLVYSQLGIFSFTPAFRLAATALAKINARTSPGLLIEQATRFIFDWGDQVIDQVREEAWSVAHMPLTSPFACCLS